jgi:hypothetical protein
VDGSAAAEVTARPAEEAAISVLLPAFEPDGAATVSPAAAAAAGTAGNMTDAASIEAATTYE